MRGWQKLVLAAGLALFGVWLTFNLPRIVAEQEGLISSVLGGLFAVLILLRPKAARTDRRVPDWLPAAAGLAGGLLALAGLIFKVHQFEWLGLCLLLAACLVAALPAVAARDALLAVFVLFWMHPVPGQVFNGLQLQMQKLSIKGAEWVLHCLNFRCWADADGFILRAGFKSFGVPEACSGMRAVVTILLCVLGTGLLLRLRWYELGVFLGLALAQVLTLNIIRIAGMVCFARKMPTEWSSTFLHDTMGTLLLVALILIQIEMSMWRVWISLVRRKRSGIASGELERPDKASVLPRIWQHALRWSGAVFLAAGIAGTLAIMVYRHRPAHRAAMIGGILDELAESDLPAADRAVRAALALAPTDRGLQTQYLRVLVMRGKFQEALQQKQRLQEPLSTMETVLTSWALMSLGHGDEAIRLVDGLSDQDRNLPGVAIVRAEYAAMRREPDEVSRNVILAARAHTLADKVRNLFPFLAAHEQWQTIVEADCDMPYRKPEHALVAVQANLRLNRGAGAMRTMKAALQQWPNDARFLDPLFRLALLRPGTEWEEALARNFNANVEQLDQQQLSTYLNYCFELSRPDLGWRAYRQLAKRDPNDPTLALAVARFGPAWFLFRSHQLGLKAPNRTDRTDLAPFLREAAAISSYRGLLAAVPGANEVLAGTPEAVQRQSLTRGLAELARRENVGGLPLHLDTLYANALAMDGQYEAAHRRLDRISERHPELKRDGELLRATFYTEQKRWSEVYETLRGFVQETTATPDLRAAGMQINATMNLNLAVYALELAQRMRRSFPESAELAANLAAIWAVFHYDEEALFELTRAGIDNTSRIVPQLLHNTERFQAAEKLATALGVGLAKPPLAGRQALMLPPAELTIEKRWADPLTGAQMAEAATRLKREPEPAGCPFLRDLQQLTADWYAAGGKGEAATVARWKAVGRDSLEQGVALHRLAAYMARQRDYATAQAAAREAVVLLPNSPILRRMVIALSDGETQNVEAARRVCPTDGEIWLAALVTGARDGKPAAWFDAQATDATNGNYFAVGTVVRAGDFMLRKGYDRAAVALARYAQAHGRGLLPSHVLALLTALKTRDWDWANTAAMRGVENARDPTPFFKTLVYTKTVQHNRDADLRAALEYLREHLPGERAWTERLGFEYFVDGDTKRVLSVLGPLIDKRAADVRVHSLLLAAEAARVQGQAARAIEILESAHAMYPDKLSVLNNLVYTLAQEAPTLPRAQALLPKLIEQGQQKPVVCDTIAAVYLRAGNLAEAKRYSDISLKAIDRKEYSALESQLNAAEILLRSHDTRGARELLDGVRKDSRRPAFIEAGLRDLTRKLEEAERR